MTLDSDIQLSASKNFWLTLETEEEEKQPRSEPTTFDTDVQRSTTRAGSPTSFHQLSQRIPARHFLFFSRNVRSGSEVGRSNSFSAESETWRNSDTKKKNFLFFVSATWLLLQNASLWFVLWTYFIYKYGPVPASSWIYFSLCLCWLLDYNW